MARHCAVSDRPRWRRSPAPAVIPVPRSPGIEVVDALTKLAHRVSPDELVAGSGAEELSGALRGAVPGGELG
jgi:hypothetical protein